MFSLQLPFPHPQQSAAHVPSQMFPRRSAKMFAAKLFGKPSGVPNGTRTDLRQRLSPLLNVPIHKLPRHLRKRPNGVVRQAVVRKSSARWHIRRHSTNPARLRSNPKVVVLVRDDCGDLAVHQWQRKFSKTLLILEMETIGGIAFVQRRSALALAAKKKPGLALFCCARASAIAAIRSAMAIPEYQKAVFENLRCHWCTARSTAIIADKDNNLWLERSRAGFVEWRRMCHLALDYGRRPADNTIRTFFEDDEGNLWIGTLSSGLSRWRKSF